jgi:hypothetical protein
MTATSLTNKHFYGGTPASEPGIFNEVFGAIRGDLGGGYWLVSFYSWRTQEPCPGDQVTHLSVMMAGEWEFFETRNELLRHIDKVHSHNDAGGDTDDKVVPLTRH